MWQIQSLFGKGGVFNLNSCPPVYIFRNEALFTLARQARKCAEAYIQVRRTTKRADWRSQGGKELFFWM